MYGTARQAGIPGRISAGTLVWRFQSTLRTVIVTTPLTNINDQFSYLVRVPCETEVGGFPAATNVLSLISVPRTYNRSSVTLITSGSAESYPVFVNASQTNLVMASADRGRVERVDLLVLTPPTDLDGNGLADAWELQYFGFRGVDPNDDPDFDGMNNRAEFLAGTNPADASSRFAFVRVVAEPSGVRVEWPSADGVFYALQRSAEVTTGFTNFAVHLPATPPLNRFSDTNDFVGGRFFYRLQVEP